MQENGTVSFVIILFELQRSTNFHIIEKFHDHCFLNFADRIVLKEIAFSSFSKKKKKYQKTAITCHVVRFSAKYDNI